MTERLPRQEKLPADPVKAIERLAHEVNRLSGENAALIAFIKSLGFETDLTPDQLTLKAVERQSPMLVPTSGPVVLVPHASITASRLLSKSDD